LNTSSGGHEFAPPLADALRVAAAAWRHLRTGRSLELALADAHGARRFLSQPDHPRLAAAAKDIAYDATRRLALLDALIAELVPRRPAPDIAALLAVALAQLLAERHAQYAVVDQAVLATKADPLTRGASRMINAVLRTFLRRRDELMRAVQDDDCIQTNLPRWWLKRLQDGHPGEWRAIARAQRLPPPLVLRVNSRRLTVPAYLDRLARAGIRAQRVGAQAVWLHEPRSADRIPGFSDGEVSVQDAGAQLAAHFLALRDGQRVLDACAAPGGKTGHMAELADVSIEAIDSDPRRAALIESNLARLGTGRSQRVSVRVADALNLTTAAIGMFDRVLLDAPCTASGIVRRHPDIPWLRRQGDVANLATLQCRLFDALWPLVNPAGRLLYVVCSLFAEEGAERVARIVARHADARAVPLPGLSTPTLQLLPSALDIDSDCADPLPSVHDGFLYALFEKT